MKKSLSLLLIMSMIALNGCTPASGSAPDSSSSAASQEVSSEAPASEPEDNAPEALPSIPADAALYRGVVTGLVQEAEQWQVTLEKTPGTSFQDGAVTVLLDDTTDFWDGDPSVFAEGDHLELYYSSSASTPDGQTVIAVVRLMDAEAIYFNGIVKEILPNEENPSAGLLILTDLDGNSEIHYHYDENTQFYLDFDALQPGDKLNLFTTGIIAESMPPQGFFLEARPYQE